MSLGLTQPHTEMSTRNTSWGGGGKGGRCVGLTLPNSCADCLEIWDPQPPGTLRACPGLYGIALTFTYLEASDYLQALAAFLPWWGLPVPIQYEARWAHRPGHSSLKTSVCPSRESNHNFSVVHPITKLLYTKTQNTYKSSRVKQSQMNKMTHTNEQFVTAPGTLLISVADRRFLQILRELTHHYVTGLTRGNTVRILFGWARLMIPK